MQLFGLSITRNKSQIVEREKAAMTPVRASSWFGSVLESFSGAWQSGVVVDDTKSLLAFSAVYACVTIIANDISKLGLALLRETDDGIYEEAESPAFSPVLRKPNRYQNRIKFIEQWILSKLIHGNTYILKQRDERRVVTALYVLPAQRVQALVAEDGGVYYRINVDPLSSVTEPIVVPASEIIHDMMAALWHPLVGVSPISACGASATMGNNIQKNSSKFFANMSRPSGHLTAPGDISDETAERLKRQFETMFSGENLGRLLVTGDGLKYEPLAIPADDAQLIEQLKWTVEDVARAFHMPMYKLGGTAPTYNNIEALNQAYYNDCLQPLIECIELCLEEGLAVPSKYEIEFELHELLRMDTPARYKSYSEGIGSGWLKPNEARKAENKPPVQGGDTPYLQQQNYSLAALAKRDAAGPAPASGPAAPGEPADAPDKPADTPDDPNAKSIGLLSNDEAADRLIRYLELAFEDAEA